jgi:DNA-binding beta-propeller fold protein YncE
MLVLSGCSSQVAKTEFFRDSSLTTVWPQLPEQPRIKLLKVYNGPEEFTAPKSRFKTLFEAITGEQLQPVGLMTPAGVVSDGERYIYIADPSARLVHKIDIVDNEATYLTYAGMEPLASPVGVALDSDGNCYVTDSIKAKVYKFNSKGVYVGILGGGVTEFQRPAGIAIGRNDYKYVADVLTNKITVFDEKDRYLMEFPDSAEAKELNKPVNIAVDTKGNLYVTDAFNFTVKVFDNKGKLVRTIGSVGDGPGSFARPKGVALDSDAHIYIIDANFDNFQIFNQSGQLLLYVGNTGKKPGQFFMPNGIFIDRDDRIYVSDSYNQRIQIFQYLKDTRQN